MAFIPPPPHWSGPPPRFDGGGGGPVIQGNPPPGLGYSAATWSYAGNGAPLPPLQPRGGFSTPSPQPGIGPIRRGPNGELIYFGMPGPQGFRPPPPRWGGPPPRFDGPFPPAPPPVIQGGPPPPNFRHQGAF